MRLSILAVFASAALGSLHAQTLYTTGHGDIGVGYDPTELAFEPHWHLSVPEDAEYAPDEAVAVIQSSAASPTGSAGALGVADGTTVWLAGSSAHQPNLGFATEELDPADWDGNITLSLTGWSGPGEFALYTTNMTGTAVVDVYLSTFNPAATFGGNSFEMFPGDHEHFTLGFTAPGHYELEFTWTGTHVTDGVITTTATFGFDVVPEPTSVAMIAFGAVLVLNRRRKCR